MWWHASFWLWQCLLVVVCVCVVVVGGVLHSANFHAMEQRAPSPVQWSGRSNVLFGVVAAVPSVQSSLAVGAMLVAWALSEVIRLPWYSASLLGACPAWLTWLRSVAKWGGGRL